MTSMIGGVEYIPGSYGQERRSAAELADRYIREWDERRLQAKVEKRTFPAICFSRKIGVGALEIADLVAPELGYRVADRELLEHIAREAGLSEKTVSLFDERYRGRVNELLAMAFGEKSFIKSDYTRHLFGTAIAMSGLEPTIFVGRGIHLILPRDQVLAVRFICSDGHRAKRLSRILGVMEKYVTDDLAKIDREQRDFFRSVYGKKEASPYEFDLVIHCDHLREPGWAARIVVQAFQDKFGSFEKAAQPARAVS